MHIERHIFGSRIGYTTLAASGGLDPEIRKAMESFSFGQTSNPSYIKSLSDNPAYMSRPLPGDRRAITRVLAGQPDDNGRNTLLFVSAIFSNADWIGVLGGNACAILSQKEIWRWDGQTAIPAMDISCQGHRDSVNASQLRQAMEIISAIEDADCQGASVIIDERHCTLNTICLVEMCIPDAIKPRFSCAYRSLSAGVNATLNCLAESASRANSRQGAIVCKPNGNAELSPYAAEMAKQAAGGTVPWQTIRSYSKFGAAGFSGQIDQVDHDVSPAEDVSRYCGATTNRQPEQPIKRKVSPMAKVIIVSIIAAVVVLGGLAALLNMRRSASEHCQRLRNEATSIRQIDDATFVALPDAARSEKLQQARQLLSLLGMQEELSTDCRNLSGWITAREAVNKDLELAIADLTAIEKTGNVIVDAFKNSHPKRQVSAKLTGDINAWLQRVVQLQQRSLTGMNPPMLLSGIFPARFNALSEVSRQIDAQIKSRQEEWEAFCQKMQNVVNVDPKLLVGYSDDVADWRFFCQDDPEKLKKISDIKSQIQSQLGQAKSNERELFRCKMELQGIRNALDLLDGSSLEDAVLDELPEEDAERLRSIRAKLFPQASSQPTSAPASQASTSPTSAPASRTTSENTDSQPAASTMPQRKEAHQ